jgi:hypothetical protein
MAAPTDKPSDKSATAAEAKPEQQTQQKSAGALEEDDEFEDFPVEGAFHSSSCEHQSNIPCLSLVPGDATQSASFFLLARLWERPRLPL